MRLLQSRSVVMLLGLLLCTFQVCKIAQCAVVTYSFMWVRLYSRGMLSYHNSQACLPIARGATMIEAWMSADDIAEHLGVTKHTISGWINDRSMPAPILGSLWKFQASEVDEWVRTGAAATTDELDEL